MVIFGKTGLTYAPSFQLIPFRGLFVFSPDLFRFVPLLIFMFIPAMVSWVLLAKGAMLRRWGGCIWLIWLLNLGLVTCMAPASYKELVSAGRLSTGVVLAMLLYGWQIKNTVVLQGAQIYALTFPLYALGVLLIHFPS